MDLRSWRWTGDIVTLEPVVDPRREAYETASTPRGRARAAIVDVRRVRGIVTVISDAAPTRAQVIVRIAVIDGQRRVKVPGQLLVDLVFISQSKHVGVVIRVGRIVIVLPTRIARRLSRMRPTGAHTVLLVERLRQGEPGTEPLTLVLEFKCSRNVAFQVLRDSVHGQTETELILRADLYRGLIADVLQVGRRTHRLLIGGEAAKTRIIDVRAGARARQVAIGRVVRANPITVAIDVLMQLLRGLG